MSGTAIIEIAARRKKAPAIQQPSEEALQRTVIAMLRWAAKPGVYFYAVPNGGQRNSIVAAKMKATGTVAGVPDIALVIDGCAHFLELKRERGGRLSDVQKAQHERIVAAGGIVATARGLDEALAILEDWGAIRKAGSGRDHQEEAS